MKKREILLLSSLTFSLGVVFGFLLSPLKQGIIVNVNGRDNVNNNNYDKKYSTTDES